MIEWQAVAKRIVLCDEDDAGGREVLPVRAALDVSTSLNYSIIRACDTFEF